MNELLRMRYLDAVGIDVFVPRYELPAGLVSVPCLLPERVQDNYHSPVSQVAIAPVLGGSAQGVVESLLPRIAPRAFEPADKQGADSTALVAMEVPERVCFSLGVWRISEALLAVDSREVGAALPTDTLLKNIMLACGVSSRFPVADNLAWPLTDVPGKPQGWAEARDMVATYLEGKLVRPVGYMLVFGKDAYLAIAGGDDYPDRLWQRMESNVFACDMLIFPGLAELLRDPCNKSRVWRSLCAHGVVQARVE